MNGRGYGDGNERIEVDGSRDGSVGSWVEESLSLERGWEGGCKIRLGGIFEV